MNLGAVIGKAYLAVPKETKGPLTITRVSSGALDPVTDTVADEGVLSQDAVAFAVPVAPDTRRPTVEQTRALALVVSASVLAWPPRHGDRVTWNESEWTITALTAVPNRAHPVAYRLVVSQ